MKQLTTKFKSLSLLFSLIALFAFLPVNSFGQSDDETIGSAKTASGELKLVKISDGDIQRIVIKLGDKFLTDGTNNGAVSGEIYGSFPAKTPKIFLIEFANNSLACNAQFVIVDLSGKSPKVSKEFGNCSDTPKIIYKNQSLTLTFPPGQENEAYKAGEQQVWRYGKGKLQKIK